MNHNGYKMCRPETQRQLRLMQESLSPVFFRLSRARTDSQTRQYDPDVHSATAGWLHFRNGPKQIPAKTAAILQTVICHPSQKIL